MAPMISSKSRTEQRAQVGLMTKVTTVTIERLNFGSLIAVTEWMCLQLWLMRSS